MQDVSEFFSEWFKSPLEQWQSAGDPSDMVNTTVIHFIETMNGGGVLMWMLFCLGGVLWYALAARFALLGMGATELAKGRDGVVELPQRGYMSHAARDALNAYAQSVRCGGTARHFVRGALIGYRTELGRYSTLIKTIVLVAPLLGLLGTVIGMIETFEALQTLSIFSQGSSIAGGVSKALFTTQMGLIVAVPGLLLGRVLDRRQAKLSHVLEQINAQVMFRG